MTLLNQQYRTLIESDHVSPQTKEVLLLRLRDDASLYQPMALTLDQFETLRQVLARVIPQPGFGVDIAAALDRQLAQGEGDGWRYATLPSDVDAYRAGLALLEEFAAARSERFAAARSASPFGRLSVEAQDSLLEAVAPGQISSPNFDLVHWFEDLRADATRIYVSHPQTLAQMGYSGIADDQNGFVQLGIGEREPWEPEPL